MAKTLKFAVKQTIPVFCGYIFLGIAFGLLLQKAGFSFIWAFLISLIVYAGSMQFVLVGLLSGGASLATVAVMTLMINSRHIFYGLSFIEKFKKMGRRYWYMIFSLTDETYSVLCSVKVPSEMDEKRVLFLIALLDHIYWITGSVIGALIGEKIPFNSQGIDFAMTALFIVIFLEQWKESKTHIPALTGILISVLFLKLMGPASFLMPALIMIVLILLMGKSRIIRELGCEDVPTNEHVQQEHSQEEGIS